jgi:hypothetical protein
LLENNLHSSGNDLGRFPLEFRDETEDDGNLANGQCMGQAAGYGFSLEQQLIS